MDRDNDWELGRKVSYFNGSLRKLRMARGLRQEDVAKGIGVTKNMISHIETMRTLPSKETAEKIAKFFGVKPTDIFPEFLGLLSEKLTKTEIRYAQLDTLALEEFTQKQLLLQEENSDPEEVYRKKEIHDRITDALYKLTDRERKIISLRYGLLGEKPHTQGEVAAIFDLTSSRISALELKALGKIRKSDEIKEIKQIKNLDLQEEN